MTQEYINREFWALVGTIDMSSFERAALPVRGKRLKVSVYSPITSNPGARGEDSPLVLV